jgi:RNAse (barnase) inhibitor barstar
MVVHRPSEVAPDMATPLYRLTEDEAQNVILTALDMRGFFSALLLDGAPIVEMTGASLESETRPQTFHDIELEVIDVHGGVIGSYYVGDVDLLATQPSDQLGAVDVRLSFGGYRVEYPHAGEVWRRWASGRPTATGEWKDYLPDRHVSWLHVAQNAWFRSGHRSSRYSNEVRYTLDGSAVIDEASFYCAIGEAINGPGGYFGSNLDALADCLGNARADNSVLELVWTDAERSRRAFKPEFDAIVSVLQEFGVDVTLV